MEDMPVYLFTGFLESGKTTFIIDTLKDKRFNNGERTLLLLCEEGEVEYETDEDYMKNIFIETIENESDLTEKVLSYLEKKHDVERVIVEYNGMWNIGTLMDNMPESWAIYQEFSFADSTTFLMHYANNGMRSLILDKLSSTDLIAFNRFEEGMDMMDYHKIVRQASRRAQICYEDKDGNVEYDDIEDPLPYDLDAPVVEIKDEDYAIYYRDVTEDARKYDNKVLEYKAAAVLNPRFKSGNFAFGRQVMTCCVEDIMFASFLGQTTTSNMPKDHAWYKFRMRCNFKFHRLYGRKGPVFTVLSMEPTTPPEEEVATFF